MDVRLTNLKISVGECSLLYMQNANLKSLKAQKLLAAYYPHTHCILKLVSLGRQDRKLGGPLNRKMPVKINKCPFYIQA